MSQNKFILASQSPRRKELLSLLGINYQCVTSDVEEIMQEGLTCKEQVERLALIKAEEVRNSHEDYVILGFDTIVALDETILGKPIDRVDAFNMLRMLSGKTHRVLTGCAVIVKDHKYTFTEETHVTFHEMSDLEIDEYLDTNEAYDKAGAYGIQGHAAKFVQSIEGDFYTVMGLPLARLYHELKKFLEA